jgi:hypothetical protein
LHLLGQENIKIIDARQKYIDALVDKLCGEEKGMGTLLKKMLIVKK